MSVQAVPIEDQNFKIAFDPLQLVESPSQCFQWPKIPVLPLRFNRHTWTIVWLPENKIE